MKYLPVPAMPWFRTGTLLASLWLLAPGAQAQTVAITYDLNDVWLLPDISHPRAQAQKMTGTFVWTYSVGQFENGTGKFVSLAIPWWGTRTTPGIKITFDRKAIEFAMVGNYHGLGLDLSLRLSPVLAPYKTSPIDTVNSKFQIEVGVSHKGHVSKGSIVPRCPLPKNYGSGSAGSGKYVPTITSSGGDPRIGTASFRIDCDRLLGGASCFLLLGTGKAQFQFIGVTVLVDPSNWILLPLQASGAAGVAGVGTLRVPVAIPKMPILIGADFHFQAVALDKGAPLGLAAATNGLSGVVCQ